VKEFKVPKRNKTTTKN